MEALHDSFETDTRAFVMRSPKVYATPADFSKKKAIITYLYKEKNWPLKKVMAFLEVESQFFATKKMYDGRLKAWGIQKNLKQHEVIATLKAKQPRDAEGKPSELVVRGQEINPTRIHNYVRHRPDILRHIGVSSQSGDVLAGICARTPSQPLSIPCLPHQHREDVLSAFNEWIVRSNLWSFAGNGDEVKVSCDTAKWLADWQNAISNTRDGNAARGVRYIGSICQEAEKIFRINNPNITNMFSRLAYLRVAGEDGFLLHDWCVEYLHKLAVKSFGAHYPLTRILAYLRAPISDSRHIGAHELLQLAMGPFERHFGLATTLTTDLYCDLSFVALKLGETDRSDLVQSLKDRLVAAETQHSAEHQSVVFLKMKTAEILSHIGRLSEARELMLDAMKSTCDGSWHKAWGLLGRGILEVKLGNDFAAENLLHIAIREARNNLGNDGNGLVNRCGLELRVLMLRANRVQEAHFFDNRIEEDLLNAEQEYPAIP